MIVSGRKLSENTPLRPAIAGLVQIDMNAVVADINNVRRAGAVGIRQADALLVEEVIVFKPRRIVHGDLGPESSIAEIGPIADFPVADADNIRKTIAGHIGQVD